MRVYFTGSLHNERISKDLYELIIKIVKRMGHSIKADHIMNVTVPQIESQTLNQRLEYYNKLNSWIDEADVFVCECSYPSTVNIGHEISLALNKGKPAICLYMADRAPGILQGNNSGKLLLLEYTEDSLEQVLTFGLEEASSWLSRRFTMIIPSTIDAFLSDNTKSTGKTRSEYIRDLIMEDMKKRGEG